MFVVTKPVMCRNQIQTLLAGIAWRWQLKLVLTLFVTSTKLLCVELG